MPIPTTPKDEAAKARVKTIVQSAVVAALKATGWDETLAVAPIAPPEVAELRSIDFGAAGIQVDDDGTIRNCAVMTVGPTIGHPFAIDATTLLQARDIINAQPEGVKIRFKHPGKTPEGTVADDAGSVVGRLMPNTRIVGECLRGDVQIGDYAANLPGQGDARAYLIGIAKQDPQAIGLSVVMLWTPDRGADGSIVARVSDVWACDFVGKPAANPNGLLSAITPAPKPAKNSNGQESAAMLAAAVNPPGSAPQTGKAVQMDPKMKAQLVAMGMNPDATDEQAKAFLEAMTPEKQEEMAAKCAAGDDDADTGAAMDAAAPPADAPPVKEEKKPLASASAAVAAVRVAPVNYVALEAKRVGDLRQLGKILGVTDAVVNEQIGKGAGPATARTAYLAALSVTAAPVKGLIVGQDAAQVAMMQAIPEALSLRAGNLGGIKSPHELSLKLSGLRMIHMGHRWLSSLGFDSSYISDSRMADVLLSRREMRREFPRIAMLSESVGDFPSLLLDAMNKTFRPLYLDAPKTWPQWVRKTSAPDFKNINRTAMSEVGSLVRRDQGGQITYTTITDGKETYNLAEYVGGVKITRKAIINDDLDAFGRIPQLQANACWRSEEEGVYGVLTANAALGVDGVALFHATHANLVAVTANVGAPTVTTMAGSEKLMITQKGPKNAARLALRPKFLITPAALKATSEQFLTSTNLIAVISTSSSAPQTVGQANPYSGKFVHIWTPILDDTSATTWFIAADYRESQCDTLEIAFLDGEPEPVLRQETDFDSEDVKFAVRHTHAEKAIDFRGLVKNPGA